MLGLLLDLLSTFARLPGLRRTRVFFSAGNRLLNLALLVLAGGALALFIGLGYVMLGRRRAAKIAEAEAAIAAEAQNAA